MATKPPTRSEVNDLIQQVRGMPDLVKFELYSVLRDDLAGSLDPETAEARLIRERREALEYIGNAIKELGLGPREVPKQAQFDELAKKREWPFDGAKVQRVFERWSIATDAYLGLRKIETPAGRRRRKREYGPKGPLIEKHVEALRTWLASDPPLRSWAAYDEFAQAYNQHVPEGKLALARGTTIERALPLSFENAIKVSEGELTADEAIERDLEERLPTITPDTLVGIPTVARVLKIAPQNVHELSGSDENFPTPVAHLSRHTAWLYSDIKLYKRGLKVPERKMDERQRTVMGLAELAAALETREANIRRWISAQDWSRVPKPEGALNKGANYWLREKVEAWQDHKAKADKTKAQEQTRERAAVKRQAEAKKKAKQQARQRALGREKAARAKATKR